MSLTFHHHAILVSDLDGAEAFYGDVLGLAVKKRWFGEDGAPRSVWFSLGADAFLAVELHDAKERSDSGHHCFALAMSVDERDEWLSLLARANVTIEKQSEFSVYFRDPENNQIALSHWPLRRKRSRPKG